MSNAAVLMFGGIETTEGIIANAALHLLAHPEQLALVEADRDLLPNAVEESLRLEPGGRGDRPLRDAGRPISAAPRSAAASS